MLEINYPTQNPACPMQISPRDPLNVFIPVAGALPITIRRGWNRVDR